MCDKLDKIKTLSERISNQMEFVDTLMAALDTSHEGIAILNEKGEYTWMNSAHEAMFGYSEGELIGKTWEVLYDESDIKYFQKNVFPLIASEGKWNGKYVAKDKLGNPVNEDVYLTSLPNGGLICTCRINICNTCDLKTEKDA